MRPSWRLGALAGNIMPDDGLAAQLEAWFVSTLAALTDDDENAIFKTADHWKHQVAATGAGREAFDRYAPFAFVAYQAGDSAREGGHDLREVLTIGVFIGQIAREPGTARFGDADTLGTSTLRDLVIAAFESKHPGAELECDEIYYSHDVVVIDETKAHAIEMFFDVSKMTPNK